MSIIVENLVISNTFTKGRWDGNATLKHKITGEMFATGELAELCDAFPMVPVASTDNDENQLKLAKVIRELEEFNRI